ncbi:unnamed protein product [Prorocentrum cordatum]|uniref:Uncharacterized protein n=1 Tax=Prorocentrum cordatum TaxID=2364126 RepID=A0ABN9XSP7_9DINO|nr:unnamed protein product [Polarella glacialis]
MAEACAQQALARTFLARCVQRLEDDQNAAGTQQAAALLATDLWLSASPGGDELWAREALADLLGALRAAAQRQQGLTAQLVAFSCLSRLLSELCERRDPENTPAAYRTFVYALVESESAAAREFALRNLQALLRRHEGVPVGIIVELMVKKFQVNPPEPLAIIDIELFTVIAKHPRCASRHAEMLAQVLARCSVESADTGRAAAVPLLAVLHRFGEDETIVAFFERFTQVALARLLQRHTPQRHTTQILEVFAKVACLAGARRLQDALRTLLWEVCKAYLSSYQSLHPNLDALLALWPADKEALNAWAEDQFRQLPSRAGSDAGSSAADRPNSKEESLYLQSLTPSLTGSPPQTAGRDRSSRAYARQRSVQEEPGPAEARAEDAEDSLELVFPNLPFGEVDPAAFERELHTGLAALGASAEALAQVALSLRDGSTIAQLRGPAPVIAELKALPLGSLVILGHSPQALKEEGNGLVREGKKAEALERYEEGLRLMGLPHGEAGRGAEAVLKDQPLESRELLSILASNAAQAKTRTA